MNLAGILNNMMSQRNYLTIPELEQFADIVVTDAAEALDQISQAEELIDSYVGYQNRFMPRPKTGQATAVISKTIFDIDNRTNLDVYDGFYEGCILRIVGGSGKGSSRLIASSNKLAKSVTYEGELIALDSTSIFEISQLGKFPRRKDVVMNRDSTLYLKSIPEAVRRATAAQVEYMIGMGAEFFSGDDADYNSENIGSYGYSKGSTSGNMNANIKMIAPRARTLLRGYKNSTGVILREET